jgi:ABC-2 type transport system ATP-binding protein
LFAFDGNGNVPALNLSGGWQRRLHVAIALLQRSSVVILDEPTAGLDIEARMELWAIIRRLKSDGISFLVSTHDLAEAERMCDRVGILHEGRIVAEGSLGELQNLVPAARLAELDSPDLGAVRARCAELGWVVREYAGRTTTWLPNRMEIAELVDCLEGLQLDSVTMRDVGLEQIWLEVTQTLAVDDPRREDLALELPSGVKFRVQV